MKTFNKLNYSILPTPLHKLENLSKRFNVNIYCKRDDLTGFAFGGNKTRKLDYLIYEAIQSGADTIIAVGAYQSNFCRIASAYGATTGLEVRLVLGGVRPEKATGNLLLDNLFGAKIHDVESFDWDDWEMEAEVLRKTLEEQGKKLYKMPIGGSTSTGALGYIDCMKEIKDFSKKEGIYFKEIFHATGSAGTQTGLVAGKSVTQYDVTINGIAITKNAKQIANEVETLCTETGEKIEAEVNYKDIVVDDKYIGDAYGAETKEANEAILLFAQDEGILLDKVYSGKAAAGMIDYVRKNKTDMKSNLLFIHTGGNIQLFK